MRKSFVVWKSEVTNKYGRCQIIMQTASNDNATASMIIALEIQTMFHRNESKSRHFDSSSEIHSGIDTRTPSLPSIC